MVAMKPMFQNIKTGKIIRLRNRLWIVDSVYDNELLATTIDSYNNFSKQVYIPFEEIEEVENLKPDISQVGDLASQKLYLTAQKLSLIHGTSPLMSMQTSSIIPTNFQLVPVIMALNQPRIRMLIADDVGLGKTIEAGMIINELIARQRAYKILIICPANLREQWQEALSLQFKQEFLIISTIHKKYLEKELPVGASPWDYFNRLITSIDYIKMKAHRNEALNYKWDLVVVDEAHLCAKPHSDYYHHTPNMLRWELLQKIAKKSRHLLLLTATPHNGYTDSFASLIDVLDVNGVNTVQNTVRINHDIAKKYVCQRTREDVKDWIRSEENAFDPFPERDKDEVPIDSLSNREVRILKQLGEYGDQLNKMIEFLPTKRTIGRLVVIHLLKRALSSPQAIKISLQNRIEKLSEDEVETEIKDSDAKSTIVESDNTETITIDEAGQRIERSSFSKEVNKYEIEALKKILEEAKKQNKNNDTKYKTLINNVLPDLFKNYPKLIIFTRYTDTLDFLKDSLNKDLVDTDIFSIYGEMHTEARKEVFRQFKNSKKGILIATDCISEGMNLQYLCSQIVHYELPWNPNRMEQRNGRVDRFGQRDKVYIRTIFIKNTLDEIILKNIIEKTDRMKKDYGFAPPFFSDEDKILDILLTSGILPSTRVAEKDQISMFDGYAERQQSDTISEKPDFDEEYKAKMDQIKSESFFGHTEISLPDIEQKIKETEQTIGSHAEIKAFIESGLNLFHCSIDNKEPEEYTINITDARLQVPGVPPKIERATFDKNHAARNPGTDLIDLSHPLVSRLIQLVKQQSVSNEDFYGRTAFKGSSKIQEVIAVINILARYVVNTKPSSIVEEIFSIGFTVFDDKIIPNEIVGKFEAQDPEPCRRTNQEIREDLEAAFSKDFWKKEIERIAEDHKKTMSMERQNLIERLDHEDEQPEWVKGLTDISFVSYDILTVTIGYPV